jgi:cytochrome c
MNNNNTLMKTIKLFSLACLTLAMASCASPEERSAGNNVATDSATSSSTPVNPTDSPSVDSASAGANATHEEVAPPVVSEATAPTTAKTEAAKPAPVAKKEVMPGEALIKGSDCLACHNVTKKIVGPAYVNVAAKYPNTDENVEYLATKIIEGGSGVWGAIPMSPHPAISKSDAKEMAKYILSLKK